MGSVADIPPGTPLTNPNDITFTAYNVPLSAIMLWPPGNFTHPVTRHWFIPYAAVLQGLTTVVIVARLWTRYGKRAGGFGLDDVLIFFSFVSSS